MRKVGGRIPAGQDECTEAGGDAREGETVGQRPCRPVREYAPADLPRNAHEPGDATEGGRGEGRDAVIHQVGHLVNQEHLGDEVPREIHAGHPPELPRPTGGGQRPVCHGASAPDRHRGGGSGPGPFVDGGVPDQHSGRRQHPGDDGNREHAIGPAPAERVNEQLRQRNQGEDADADAAGGDPDGRSDPIREPAADQDDGRNPCGERDANGGDAAERQVQMPPLRRLGRQYETKARDHGAAQDRCARPETGEQPPDGRRQQAVHREKRGERARDERAAPAELFEQRDEEDRIRVPRAVT